jgi:hypothetical protein
MHRTAAKGHLSVFFSETLDRIDSQRSCSSANAYDRRRWALAHSRARRVLHPRHANCAPLAANRAWTARRDMSCSKSGLPPDQGEFHGAFGRI